LAIRRHQPCLKGSTGGNISTLEKRLLVASCWFDKNKYISYS
jgi:hypothetical protein